ncbi:MAG: hypothetical protein FJ112_09140 [Deltaproteobacteria bacterium]|nr:hypothetical protein [Deltaproteobacteria bacterium]
MRRYIILKIFRKLTVFLFSVFICHCASAPELQKNSPPPVSHALEEVNDNSAKADAVDSKNNPLVSNISETLKSLGYEALGLSFETDETLLLLGKVFDSPVTHGRKIRIIYTGLQMAYDAKHQSLTISSEKDLATILSFIDRNVPKQIPDPPADSSIQSNSTPKGLSERTRDDVPANKMFKMLKKGLSKIKGKSRNFEKKQRSSKSKTRKTIPVSSPVSSTSTTVTSTTLTPATNEEKQPTPSTTLPPASQVPDSSAPQERPLVDDAPALEGIPKQQVKPNPSLQMEEQQKNEAPPLSPEEPEVQQDSEEE